jgi:homoserine/homoserine lactone efflux protein
VYLAVKQWRALPSDLSDDAAIRPIGKPLALVFRGFLVNISNPKALVFMLAVLPQFIDPHAPLVKQYLILGATMIVVDLIVMAGYTGLASKVLRLLRTPVQQRRMNRTFAGLFLGAAGFLATIRKAAA